MIAVRRVQLPTFVLFWMAVLAVSFAITRSSQFLADPQLLSLAVTVDMVILVPLVYLVLARRAGWRLLSAVLIGNQNVILHLYGPAIARGLYGFERRFERLALAVDDVEGFLQAVSGQ